MDNNPPAAAGQPTVAGARLLLKLLEPGGPEDLLPDVLMQNIPLIVAALEAFIQNQTAAFDMNTEG